MNLAGGCGIIYILDALMVESGVAPLSKGRGRGLRSTYYSALGVPGVEGAQVAQRFTQLLAAEKLTLLQLRKLAAQQGGAPPACRARVWSLLLGVDPLLRDARAFVANERQAMFHDVRSTLATLAPPPPQQRRGSIRSRNSSTASAGGDGTVADGGRGEEIKGHTDSIIENSTLYIIRTLPATSYQVCI